MASTSISFHDGDSTILCVDEPMLPEDNGGDTTGCKDEDESMMLVDDEEDQIDDNVVAAPCEDEPMLPVEGADDAAGACLPDLPIRNILSRVPPSSATRFKVVCKSWRSMIAERTHRAAGGNARSVLLHDGEAHCPVTVVGVDEAAAGGGGGARLALRPCRRTPRHGYTVQNCCGALACLRGGRRDAELLNPATGESLGLGHFFRHGEPSTWTPAENLPWYCLGRCGAAGAAAGSEEYKVVRLDVRVPPTRRPLVTCEVLSLGLESWDPSSGSFAPEWKRVGTPVNYCPAGRGVHVAGAVYYLALSAAGAMVVSFDLVTHEVGEVDLPAPAPAVAAGGGAGAAASLSELDDRLCLSLVRASDGATVGAAMDIYVRGDDTDGGGKAWFQVGRIGLDVAARRAPRPLLRRGGRMLMKRADGSLCYYDMEGGSGNGGAAGEEVVYEHKGCPRRKQQQLSGVAADVFAESPLPLQAILLGA